MAQDGGGGGGGAGSEEGTEEEQQQVTTTTVEVEEFDLVDLDLRALTGAAWQNVCHLCVL